MNPADNDQETTGADVALDKDAGKTDVAAEAASQAEAATHEGTGDPVMKAEFQPLPDSVSKGEAASIDLLMDVTLPVTVELGKTTMTVRQVLDMGHGSVVELDRVAGEAVDVYVSGKILGRGEIVVVNDKFGVRMTEILNAVRS
jgi:flagellar motor switch protein FliN/FliY